MLETPMWCLWPDWTHTGEPDVPQIHGVGRPCACGQYADGEPGRIWYGIHAKRRGRHDAARGCCADELQDQDRDGKAAVRGWEIVMIDDTHL